MPLFIGGGQVCWLCAGSGFITTGTEERRIVCGMCAGSGVADEVPGSRVEMVSAIASLEGVEHIRLTKADIDAAVAEYGPIIEAATCEIGAEDAVQTGKAIEGQTCNVAGSRA